MEHLKDLMTTNVEYCQSGDSIYEAAQKMKNLHVGVIPICQDDRQLLGMLTDRDIVIRCIAEQKPTTTKVTDVMSDQILTGTPDMSIREAAKLMAEKQIRRLPIVETNKLVGIVALGDLAVHIGTDDEASFALSEISERPEVHH